MVSGNAPSPGEPAEGEPRPDVNTPTPSHLNPITLPALEHMARGATYRQLVDGGLEPKLGDAWAESLEVRVRYRGYLERQRRTAERQAAMDEKALPASLWETSLAGVSREAREKLLRWRPATVGQAGRIAGVTPADVAVLLVRARGSAIQEPKAFAD
jgi:tRNA uridine 5-carboxymethylaminomethyl modification enzyme